MMLGQKFSLNSLVMLFFIASMFVVSGAADNQKVYAEKEVVLEKVVNINKNDLQDTIVDLNNLKQIFPEYVKLIETIETNDGRNLARMQLGINGIYVTSEVEYSNQDNNKHVIEITTGDLQGTKLITTMKETWGFDGTPNQGTDVRIKMALHYSGFLWFLEFVPYDTFLFALDNSLDNIVSFSKNGFNESENPNNETQPASEKTEDSNSNYYSTKKGTRSR